MVRDLGEFKMGLHTKRSDKIREVKVVRNYIKNADGSVLISFGSTRVVCTASVQDRVPPHLKGKGTGWVTAEYSMLPRSTTTRMARERYKVGGRTQEIQRLIGRSLRAVIDLKMLGEQCIIVDCDVIQADGGTRTTSINGGFIALVEALRKLDKEKKLTGWPVKDYLGAISVGIVDGNPMVDLTYLDDFKASVDMNVVMTGKGRFVEIQATGEEYSFSENELEKLLDLAKRGILEVIEMQKKKIGEIK